MGVEPTSACLLDRCSSNGAPPANLAGGRDDHVGMIAPRTAAMVVVVVVAVVVIRSMASSELLQSQEVIRDAGWPVKESIAELEP
jgi:hypothetical protein